MLGLRGYKAKLVIYMVTPAALAVAIIAFGMARLYLVHRKGGNDESMRLPRDEGTCWRRRGRARRRRCRLHGHAHAPCSAAPRFTHTHLARVLALQVPAERRLRRDAGDRLVTSHRSVSGSPPPSHVVVRMSTHTHAHARTLYGGGGFYGRLDVGGRRRLLRVARRWRAAEACCG